MSAFVPDFGAIRSVIVEAFDGSSLRAFKDCHRGERCFIIGNGPSLQNTDLAPLADEITFGVNGIFYMTWQCGFTPTYYVVEDNHVFADNLDRVRSVDAVAKFFPSKYRPIVEPTAETHFLPTDWSFYWGSSEWYETPRFSHDISHVIYAGQTVTFLNLQLAAYMGCREIYLTGVDYEYTIPENAQIDGLTITSVEHDPNHFHPDYFGKGKRWHLPKLDNVGRAMLCAKEAVEAGGATIFNATIGGKLEIFPRADYQRLIGRPVFPEPNSASHYGLSRALEHAALLELKTVAVDTSLDGTVLKSIASASPLQFVDAADAEVVVTDSLRRLAGAAEHRRVLVVLGESPAEGESSATPLEWLSELLLDRLMKRGAAFLTRSILELSPDGESVAIPVLARSAQVGVDPRREFGVDELGTLGESRSTRWVYGRALSIDQVAELAAAVTKAQHSIGVIDGYVYLQSRWRPTETPVAALSRRSTMTEGRRDVGIGR